jgi:D-sedoheptulose 7-phosphate isomerase
MSEHQPTSSAKSGAATFLAHLSDVCRTIDLRSIELAVDLLVDAYDADATVLSIGNGGSASTAAHFASDLAKFATWPRRGFRSIDLCSNVATLTAWTNDEGWDEAYEHQIEAWARPGDVLFAFSVHGGSGWSSNLVRAITKARDLGARTVGVAGDGGGAFVEACHLTIVIPNRCPDLVTPLAEAGAVAIHHLLVTEVRARLAG